MFVLLSVLVVMVLFAIGDGEIYFLFSVFDAVCWCPLLKEYNRRSERGFC